MAQAVDSLNAKPLGYRINIFLARLCFRGIYFPLMGRLAWVKLIAQNRRTIFKLVKEAFRAWCRLRLRNGENFDAGPEVIPQTEPTFCGFFDMRVWEQSDTCN